MGGRGGKKGQLWHKRGEGEIYHCILQSTITYKLLLVILLISGSGQGGFQGGPQIGGPQQMVGGPGPGGPYMVVDPQTGNVTSMSPQELMAGGQTGQQLR